MGEVATSSAADSSTASKCRADCSATARIGAELPVDISCSWRARRRARSCRHWSKFFQEFSKPSAATCVFERPARYHHPQVKRNCPPSDRPTKEARSRAADRAADEQPQLKEEHAMNAGVTIPQAWAKERKWDL
jgi:hypothetical protein